MKGKKIGIIGLGNMGYAILKGLISSGAAKEAAICGFDCAAGKSRGAKKDFGIVIAGSVGAVAEKSDIILIAVKPQNINPVLEELSFYVKGRLFISIAAGITTHVIEKALGGRPRVIRVMPNTPALVGEGISAVCAGKFAARADVRVADGIFSSVGETIDVPEKYFDIVTAVSGSGPAYFFYLKEALIEAAKRLGLNRQAAKVLVSKTALGSAVLLLESGHEPEVLRQRVTSKGGTTERAIRVFDKAQFKRTVERAIIAAVKRSRELSRS